MVNIWNKYRTSSRRAPSSGGAGFKMKLEAPGAGGRAKLATIQSTRREDFISPVQAQNGRVPAFAALSIIKSMHYRES
jgi:hypothetical protein